MNMLKTPSPKTIFLPLIFIGVVSMQVCAQDVNDIQLANQYFEQGDNDKALELFKTLEKGSRNIPLIHERYFQLMMMTGRFEEAEDYVQRAIKKYPTNLYYKIDLGKVYEQKNEKGKAKQYFEKLINEVAEDPFKVRVVSQHFTKQQLFEYALLAYETGRKQMNDPGAYAIQMSNIYRLLNRKEEMIEEYLRYANDHPQNIKSVQNIFQNVLREDEDLELFETIMYDKVQREPDNLIYNELLVWVSLQRKNFYSAFVQARAIDKRKKLQGNQLMEIARIAMVNKDYKNAVRTFKHIIENYPGTANYQKSRRLVITCQEEIIKSTYPVSQEAIRDLINDYRQLISDLGLNQHTVQALRSEASLYAFYLHEHDSAITILQKIIDTPRISRTIIEKSKLDLGDIYLLIGQPWESALLYAQVEKASKETPIGYEAKLKSAKLSYYRTDFELAQSHLDILKMATSREIANDAMALSLLIKDNAQLDTADVAMKRFARTDLMIFQNQKAQACDSLEVLKSEFQDHPLVDEILYRQAELQMEMGDFKTAIDLLQQVVDDHGSDILGDDALFLVGSIYEDQLRDTDKAMEVYREFLSRYPGSNKAAEARRRFRNLRGDFL
jgi:tetratricopeptide (TPR) repeat protein